jgi:hypothetical protein
LTKTLIEVGDARLIEKTLIGSEEDDESNGIGK